MSVQSCVTLRDRMDCSPPGSSVHGILQARMLEWVAISYFRESSWPRDRTFVSCIVRWILNHYTTWEAHPYISSLQFSHLVVSDSLQLRGQQHTRLPYPSPTPLLTQTYAHWVGDAMQQCHPLLSTSPPAFNLSQHEGLFQWVNSLHQVSKVLEYQLKHQSFQ